MPQSRSLAGRDPRYERLRWTIFAVTWIAYAGFYLTRKSFSVAKIGILADPSMSMNKDVMGLIDAAYLTAYAVGQFVCGILGDRFGPRRVVLVGLLGSVAASFFMGMSTYVAIFGLFFLLQGLFQSTGWAPLSKNVSCWFARNERGRVYGVWCTNYAVGGLIATPFAGYMAERYLDWRYAFYMPAGVLLGIAGIFYLYQKNRPEDVGLPPVDNYIDSKPVRAEDSAATSWKDIFEVMRNPMVLRLGLAFFLLKPARYAILFWGPLLVNETLGSGMMKSGLISSLFEAAGPLGVLAAGYASDRFFRARRVPVIVVSLILLAGVLVCFIPLCKIGGAWPMGASLFAIGFLLFGPDSLLVATAPVDFGRKKGASTAVGLVNGFGSVGAVLGGSLPGYISDRFGWNVLFCVLAGCVLVSALILIPRWNSLPETPSPETGAASQT